MSSKDEPGYYDISLLKAPVWSREVPLYFFLGGLSAGSYVLARLAERCGGTLYREVTRTGTYLSALAALPCAPLLISDLGDPKRFHHMLRIWKPSSPMNLGSWLLTSYTPLCLAAALREKTRIAGFAGSLLAATDVAGVPLALGLAGYTGVLLSTTSTPVWCKNPWLGALFSTSSLHSGAAGIQLGLALRGLSCESLDSFDKVASLAEGVALAGFLGYAGELAKPLVEGEQAGTLWGGAVACGLVAPHVLKDLPVAGKVLSAAAALVGAFALRWAVSQAGRPSALDSRAARRVSSGP